MRGRLITLAAAVVAIAGAAAAIASESTRAAGAPVPFSPQAFTATDAADWWVLGSAACGHTRCAQIMHTTDGGRSFTRVPSPTSLDGQDSRSTRAVSGLVFADPLDGYAYGPALWSTHDGGAHWHRVTVPGSVGRLAAGDGYVYATVSSGGRNSTREHLWRSPASDDNWTELTGAGDVSTGLAVRGPEVVIQNAYRYNGTGDAIGSRILVSGDHGGHFTSHRNLYGLPCQFTITSPATIWGFCSTGNFGDVVRSTNVGRTFPLAFPRSLDGEFPNSSVLGAASDSTAVLGTTVARPGRRDLARTTDEGRRYRPLGPAGFSWAYLGFTDPAHGAAIGAPANGEAEQLYATTDGGRTYRRVRFTR